MMLLGARSFVFRHGLTIDRLEQDTAGVRVHLTDGSNGYYDLVVGADGIYSSIRNMVFGDAHQPRHAGSASGAS
jgi:2-polyprenyl-6-methoxyphenol hydroxylase-like FAD-dependent oxidoreductase